MKHAVLCRKAGREAEIIFSTYPTREAAADVARQLEGIGQAARVVTAAAGATPGLTWQRSTKRARAHAG